LGLFDNQRNKRRVEISQQQFDELLQQIRNLTNRVYQLEQALNVHVSTASARPETVLRPGSTSLAPAPPPLTGPSPATSATRPVPPPAAQRTAYAQPQTDLEARIGSHWLNRIGIAAVLVGVSFFLKYAFENNWIGPTGRIIIGLLAGLGIVIWSERFRTRGYDIFSYTLKALGIGVLYLSLWASFQVYHLLPSGMVFAAMVIVTGVTCGMAVLQDAEIIAAFAIAGGFSTPVLLSTGENREIALFTYLVLLDLAILVLTFVKPWRGISILGFAGTLALYISWYNTYYDQTQLTPTLVFATLFFLVFAAAPILLLRYRGSATVPLLLALANGITYFLQGYAMLMSISTTEMAWFSLLLAALYLLLIRIRVPGADQGAQDSLRLVHLALAVGLITVAIPIPLEAHAITFGWLVESAALLWVGGRLKSDLLSWFALAALALGIGRLLFWDSFDIDRLILNSRMAEYAVAVAVLGFAAYQYAQNSDDTSRKIAATAIVALNVLALRALSLEVADYYSWQMPRGRNAFENIVRTRAISIARDFSYSALWMGYGAVLMVIGFRRASAFVRWQALVLIAITTLKVFVYDTSQLDRIYRILSFIVLGVLLLVISFAYQRNWLRLPSRETA
jgi:uncharacterized membrane protein